MRTLKLIGLSLVYFASFLLCAEGELAGNYNGNKWGFFRWGEECSICVTYEPSNNSGGTYHISFANSDEASFSVQASELDKFRQDSPNRTFKREKGSRLNEGIPKTGVELKFKKGALSQVTFWSAYLISRKEKFTCGNLRAQ